MVAAEQLLIISVSVFSFYVCQKALHCITAISQNQGIIKNQRQKLHTLAKRAEEKETILEIFFPKLLIWESIHPSIHPWKKWGEVFFPKLLIWE